MTEKTSSAPQTTVTITFAEIGWHCWPEAPQHRDYLRSRHRHVFHVEVEAQVNHHDRMIEFHDLQDMARSTWPVALGTYQGEYGRMSCEEMAAKLGSALRTGGVPVVRVSVSEDREVTSTVRWSL